jgi:hypothetical protein
MVARIRAQSVVSVRGSVWGQGELGAREHSEQLIQVVPLLNFSCNTKRHLLYMLQNLPYSTQRKHIPEVREPRAGQWRAKEGEIGQKQVQPRENIRSGCHVGSPNTSGLARLTVQEENMEA